MFSPFHRSGCQRLRPGWLWLALGFLLACAGESPTGSPGNLPTDGSIWQSSSHDLLPALAIGGHGDEREPTVDDSGIQSEDEYLDVGGDRRRGVPIPSGSSIVFDNPGVKGSELRFSVSALGSTSTILVSLLEGGHDTGIQSRMEVSEGAWTDGDLNLNSIDSQAVSIRFSAEGNSGVFVAMPRLVVGHRDSMSNPRPNVLLYLVDTLRSDHLSAYGYSRLTTPFLERIARVGFVYTNSYSTSAWTRPSTASLLTGLYPSFHRANARMSLPSEATTIGERLRPLGWSTWAIVTNGNVNAAGLNFEQGFDRFVALKGAQGQPNADEINDIVIPWLETVGDEPFFLFIHSVDPHAPYNAPETFRGRFTDPRYDGPIEPQKTKKKKLGRTQPSAEDLDFIIGLYDEEILFQDKMIEELFAVISDFGHLDRTYSIITSDHGEEFFEHGYWEHGKRLFEEQIRVPLVVIPPTYVDVEPARITSPVQGVDVVPTILKWLNIESEEGGFQGRVLPTSDLHAPASRGVYCEEIRHDSGFDLLSITDGSLKIIAKTNWETGGRKVWLFDLAVDATEQVNLTSADSGTTESLLQTLLSYSSTQLLGEPVQPRPEPKLDQDAVDQLRALGYIE